MSRRLAALAAVAAVATTAIAQASPCLDRIQALEKRVDEAGDVAAATSSGGQGVAASRESQAMQSRNQGGPTSASKVPPFQDQSREAQTTRRAADEAHGGGDRVMQARALLNEARAMDGKGDASACLARIGEAESKLSPK